MRVTRRYHRNRLRQWIDLNQSNTDAVRFLRALSAREAGNLRNRLNIPPAGARVPWNAKCERVAKNVRKDLGQ